METETKPQKNNTLMEGMFEAGAHFGYSKSKRHASVKSLIFGTKSNVEIIDLEKTSEYLARAKEFVASLGKEGKQLLFVGTKNEARNAVLDGATSINMPSVTERWIGGALTNFSEIKSRVAHLEDLTSKKEKEELDMYTKKERLMIDREISGLEKNFSGLLLMKQLPAALFIIDSKKEHIAVAEAKKEGIPVVSLSNSDCNITLIDYPILANDASRTSIEFFVDQIVSAYKEGISSKPESESEPKK